MCVSVWVRVRVRFKIRVGVRCRVQGLLQGVNLALGGDWSCREPGSWDRAQIRAKVVATDKGCSERDAFRMQAATPY